MALPEKMRSRVYWERLSPLHLEIKPGPDSPLGDLSIQIVSSGGHVLVTLPESAAQDSEIFTRMLRHICDAQIERMAAAVRGENPDA